MRSGFDGDWYRGSGSAQRECDAVMENGFLQISILIWLAACAIVDARNGEVPNALTLPAVFAGAIVSVASGWERTVVFVGIIVVTTLLHAHGLIGGADAKILVALGGLWPQLLPAVVLGVSGWCLARRVHGGSGRFRAVPPMAIAAVGSMLIRVVGGGMPLV